MYFIYSILLSAAFVLMLPLFLVRREKYAAGFKQRLGNYPEFKHDGRKVIWLHCVSVGEANAARPLVDGLLSEFPGHRVVISTTTKTGQELAGKIFAGKADAVFYFPFDWKFSVRRALNHFKPSAVLLMETEIWPRFIHEAKLAGAKIAVVNGRLSERSFGRYRKVRGFLKRVLSNIDLALMQGGDDANRLISLGLAAAKAKVTGNLKYDLRIGPDESQFADVFKGRFGIDGRRRVILAASTHEPEEKWILDAFASLGSAIGGPHPRLIIAPRHPERFKRVEELIDAFRYDGDCEWPDYTYTTRSSAPADLDKDRDIILLDSVGELRAVYSLADIVFVGGSLIPHGGQSVLEPAVSGRPIVTGPYTHNFKAITEGFLSENALVRLPEVPDEFQKSERLYEVFLELLENPERRNELARNARAVMEANRGATAKTVELLRHFLN